MPETIRAEKQGAEAQRLKEDAARRKNWKRWGPYLADRQWGTVREDYSANGDAWESFPHDQARSRAYRWGEDGLLGITDRECRLCLALAIWNGRDPILKERLFGLTNREGNHGEDVKESYYYLDATPTYSYMKALYKYPQSAFPYECLVEENRKRTREDTEFELVDTGVFNDDRYFDILIEYAKAAPDDLLMRITVQNHGPESAPLWILPTLWFRNTWIWGCRHEGCTLKPRLAQVDATTLRTTHEKLDPFLWAVDHTPDGSLPEWLFTENETNTRKLYGEDNYTPYVKDAFHSVLVEGHQDAVNPRHFGTKAAACYKLQVPPKEKIVLRTRLFSESLKPSGLFGMAFDRIFAKRKTEADAFYKTRIDPALPAELQTISRQAYAGLLWSKQFYHYIVEDWLRGDPSMPPPPATREAERNHDWAHVFNRDILSVPDKWEYPWYASWDLAFQMIPLARIDPVFAKEQLSLLLREWYMHPNGQIPAYEYNFSDANPPVHAWACWRTYKIAAAHGKRDRTFLASCFQKLLLNFTWWVNRKDRQGNHIFAGGFLGLDNIGVFDRSSVLPGGGHLDQADATGWMAFYCTTMLAMALELAQEDPVYEDMASKFFEHFIAITDAFNTLGGTGLWHEEDGFYYDQIHLGDETIPLRVRSLVGIIPLLSVEALHADVVGRLPGFSKRTKWFLQNREDLVRRIELLNRDDPKREHLLLATVCRGRLERILSVLFDEKEFLSPYGIRSVSRFHAGHPFTFTFGAQSHTVRYTPGESDTTMFGGNSNWRGPIWFPINYLLIEALERYHHFYGASFRAEFPTGSGHWLPLDQIANELARRLSVLFRTDASGKRPYQGETTHLTQKDDWRDLLEFHEYFHGDTGRGCGASHQTGWTALVTHCIEHLREQNPDKTR